MENLPVEMLEEIFRHLDFTDIKNCAKGCPQWNKIIKKLKQRARREYGALVEGIIFIKISDPYEFEKRRLGLRAWAEKFGFIFKHDARQFHFNFQW